MKLKDIRKLKNIDKDRILEMLGLETRRTTGSWLVGALGTFGVGLLVGAGVALMLAPKSGRELRSDLRDRLRRAPEDMNDAIEGVSDMARDTGIAPKTY